MVGHDVLNVNTRITLAKQHKIKLNALIQNLTIHIQMAGVFNT